MSKKEMQARLVAVLETAIQQHLRAEQTNGDLLLGGVIMSSAGKLKVNVVDKRYDTHKFTIEVTQS